jgi:hypothetical protein
MLDREDPGGGGVNLGVGNGSSAPLRRRGVSRTMTNLACASAGVVWVGFAMMFGEMALDTIAGERRPFGLLAMEVLGFAVATSLTITFAWGFYNTRLVDPPALRLSGTCVLLGLLTAFGCWLLLHYGRSPSRFLP